MADIFISYKREDRLVAERLSMALQQLGFDVWWDFELLSGDRFRQVIRAVLDQCSAVVVLWSSKSVLSPFVLDEASHALRQGKLFPAQIEKGEVDVPLGFGQTHTSDLAEWAGQLSHSGFQDLVRALEVRIGRDATIGAHRQSAQSQASAAELEAFKVAQIAGNSSALRVFLKNFPRGAFTDFVRNQLDQLESDARAEARVQLPAVVRRPDAPVWEGVKVRPAEPAGARSAGGGPSTWLLAGGGVAVLAVAGGVFFLGGGWDQMQLRQREAWAQPFTGQWAPTGLTCEYALELQVHDGVLVMAGEAPQAIQSQRADGSVVTAALDASYAYSIDGDALVVEDLADNRKQRMTRCGST